MSKARTRQRHTVVLTGSTGGIGQELARRYHERGDRLILLGRRPIRALDPLVFNSRSYVSLDLESSACGSKVLAFLDTQKIEQVDLVIHCAGIGYFGQLERQTPQNIHSIIATNFWAPVVLTKALLPRVKVPGGKIIFIGSMASRWPRLPTRSTVRVKRR
jgi:short-subunit dehydrogenase